MVKMILADDEPVITRGIRKLVDWQGLGIEIVGEYTDGKSALEGILVKKPDIALLDIYMPQMTGVELLKECQAMEVKTQVIFISGFQDFEYAKAALQYGAVDYLLKPVIREELLGAVEKCVSSIRREEPWAEEAVAEEEKEADYGRLVQVEDMVYLPVFADVLYRKEENAQMRKLVRFSLISFLEEYLEAENLGITFVKNNHIVLVLKGIERVQAKETVSGIWKEACRATGHTAVFIIGKEAYGMGEIPAAFGECLKLQSYLFFADKMQIPILSVQEPVYSQKGDPDALGEAREKVLNAIIGQDETGFENSFARYSRLLLLTADGKKEDACFYYCSAIRLAEEKMAVMGLPGRNPEMKELLEKGRGCESFGEMELLYKAAFAAYMECVRTAVVSSEKQDIRKAKDYIEKHYRENLTLGVLAEKIHMNPYYFSSFFKKNAGENFKDYLNRVRLQHAVALLVSTDKKAYEIADEVGFSDVRSFTEVFARLYGETPGGYRKRIRSADMGQDI